MKAVICRIHALAQRCGVLLVPSRLRMLQNAGQKSQCLLRLEGDRTVAVNVAGLGASHNSRISRSISFGLIGAVLSSSLRGNSARQPLLAKIYGEPEDD